MLEYVDYLYVVFEHPPKEDNAKVEKIPPLEHYIQALKDYDGKHSKKLLTEVEVTQRSDLVKKCVKRRAAGICELCGKPAPFYNKKGEPYLECHHIIPIADKGPDEVDNAVALCPNCHRKMHYLGNPSDVEKLKRVARSV